MFTTRLNPPQSQIHSPHNNHRIYPRDSYNTDRNAPRGAGALQSFWDGQNVDFPKNMFQNIFVFFLIWTWWTARSDSDGLCATIRADCVQRFWRTACSDLADCVQRCWRTARGDAGGLRAAILCMHVYACPCMCLPVHACACFYMYMHVHACACLCRHVYACTCTCLHAHACTCHYMYLHVRACTCLCMHVHASPSTCMYTHVCAPIRM